MILINDYFFFLVDCSVVIVVVDQPVASLLSLWSAFWLLPFPSLLIVICVDAVLKRMDCISSLTKTVAWTWVITTSAIARVVITLGIHLCDSFGKLVLKHLFAELVTNKSLDSFAHNFMCVNSLWPFVSANWRMRARFANTRASCLRLMNKRMVGTTVRNYWIVLLRKSSQASAQFTRREKSFA